MSAGGYYCKEMDAVSFVIDSSDTDHLHMAKMELHQPLGDEELRNARVLVLVINQDLPNAMDGSDFMDKLSFH